MLAALSPFPTAASVASVISRLACSALRPGAAAKSGEASRSSRASLRSAYLPLAQIRTSEIISPISLEPPAFFGSATLTTSRIISGHLCFFSISMNNLQSATRAPQESNDTCLGRSQSSPTPVPPLIVFEIARTFWGVHGGSSKTGRLAGMVCAKASTS